MNSNLIQNFINNRPTNGLLGQRNEKEPRKKPAPYFNIQHEVNKDLIKPLDGDGRLVNKNILNAPLYIVKDNFYNTKAFKHAVEGKANDHELGKLSNVGLTLGGLGIAGYLFSKRQTPLTKGMEFIGLGSFLASMAIWPKLAIQLPAYLIHGFNVQKEYIDSSGRKKPFYQDPQFLPWDLYSDKEIQKIGDRLGIDKNIKNRRDVIQEKMKTIAIQNNTLWMLTAGFATPIMSALICNTTEPYFAKFLNDRKNKKADKILNNLEQYSNKYQNYDIQNQLESVLRLYSDKPLDKNFRSNIIQAFTHNLDRVSATKVEKDLNLILKSNIEYNINENAGKQIYQNLINTFKENGIRKEFIQQMLPNEEGIINLLKDKKLLNTPIPLSKFRNVTTEVTQLMRTLVDKYNKTAPASLQEDFDYINDLISNNRDSEHPVRSLISKLESTKISEKTIKTLTSLAENLDEFNAKMYSLDEAAMLKIGSAPETVIANFWNNSSKEIVELFGLTPKEIEKVRSNRVLLNPLLREKFEKIASDDQLYQKVMKGLIDKVAVLNEQINPLTMTEKMFQKELPDGKGEKPIIKSLYEKVVTNTYRETAGQLRNQKLDNIASLLVGSKNFDSKISLMNLQKSFVSDRLLGVKSSFYRLINTLDFYRRIAKEPTSIDNLGTISREVKEELVELCKIITIEGHASDHATKFYMLRNPEPANDTSSIVVKNGKVVNEYFGKTKELADIGNDKYFYQNAMKTMFEMPLDKTTQELIDNSQIKKELVNYRNLTLDILGGEKYFAKPRHLVRSINNASSEIKFLITGIATDEFFFKSCRQLFNTHYWKKTFVRFGAGLLGVTVLAQFFFGKTKASKKGAVKND